MFYLRYLAKKIKRSFKIHLEKEETKANPVMFHLKKVKI